MHTLEELEYVLVHRGGRGQLFEYELLYDGDGGAKPHLSGLIDVAALKSIYDANKEHAKPNLEGSSSPQVGPKEPPSRSAPSAANPASTGLPEELPSARAKTHVSKLNGHGRSYTQDAPLLPLAAQAGD
jgi:hypothetical protein